MDAKLITASRIFVFLTTSALISACGASDGEQAHESNVTPSAATKIDVEVDAGVKELGFEPWGVSPDCEDKALVAYCQKWKVNGFCYNRAYEPQSREYCAKTCGYCR